MYADWTDPYDIDHYFDDVGKIFTKVAAYADPAKPVTVVPQQPTAIESAPVGVGIIQNPVVAQPPVATPDTSAGVVKSGFDVAPDSIFIDGHSVGRQPPYNILRSGPPKDGYMNRHGGQYDMYHNERPYNCGRFDPWVIILWIIIGMLVIQILRLNAVVYSNQMILHSLMQSFGKKM